MICFFSGVIAGTSKTGQRRELRNREVYIEIAEIRNGEATGGAQSRFKNARCRFYKRASYESSLLFSLCFAKWVKRDSEANEMSVGAHDKSKGAHRRASGAK